MTIEILMVIGFCLAAYSIVGNDVPQTLGTFISSNAHRPWWVSLALYQQHFGGGVDLWLVCIRCG